MRVLIQFLRNETGAITIEFTTLVPAFVLLLVFFIDASMVYLTRSEMFNVARDTARRMATGQFTTSGEVRNYAASQLGLGERLYVLDPDFGADKTVTMAIRIGDAAIFGVWFDGFLGQDSIVRNVIWARAVVHSEPLSGNLDDVPDA